MSIDISIKQKGFLKKTMPLEVILGAELHYGKFDGLRLAMDEMDEGEFIAYNPKHIGRGFSVIWNPQEKGCIILRALLPTIPEELSDFYRTVKRITDYWKCDMEVDGTPLSPSEFLAQYNEMLDFNESSAKDVFRCIRSGESSDLSLFCAMWPLNIGLEEAEQFDQEPQTFYKWLHEKQTIDAYYAKPAFYRTEFGIVGRYVLTEDTRSIFPVEPYVPFGFDDPETGKQLKCDVYKVALYSITKDAGIGELEYQEFLERIEGKAVRYDAKCFIFEGQTLAEMESMLE